MKKSKNILAIAFIVFVSTISFAMAVETFLLGHKELNSSEAISGERTDVPMYVPNEIIIKYKAEAAEIIAEQISWNISAEEISVSDSLDELNRIYGVREIEQLFPNFKAQQAKIKKLIKTAPQLLTEKEERLVRRMRRAPKGAKIPAMERIYRIKLGLGQSVPLAAAEYRQDLDIEYAVPNYTVSICATPNDSNYSVQWALNNTGQSYPIPGGGTSNGTTDCDIDAPEGWDINTGSSNVIVAVIDTGVDYNHRDLQNNMWINQQEYNGTPNVDDDENGYIDDIYGYDFCTYIQAPDSDPNDDHGHGTHCAGTIAADSNNGLDIAGVCWNAKIMAVKFLGYTGSGSYVDSIYAIQYAVDNGADVLSNSWGGTYDFEPLEEMLDYAYSQGAVVVAGAGNDNKSSPFYPAYYGTVIAVAATDSNDQKASFSNYGDWIDVAAPGVDILSLRADGTGDPNRFYPYGDPNAKMYIASGTSMACPHVSGLAALCIAEDSNLTPGDTGLLIKLNADDINDPNLGEGRINAYATLNAIPPNFPDPNKATNPYPADDANFVSINTYLSWSSDEYSSSYDVYLGTDFNDVNDANTSSGVFQGNVLIPKFEPNTLNKNTLYYWRIDTRNYSDSTKGDVWDFTTRNGDIIYVDKDATGTGDGMSWANAFTKLDDALDIAVNDEIWAAEGTYKPDSNDRSTSFSPPENTRIYGGFAGTESSRDGRDPNLLVNVTILSGDINSPNDVNDNCYHVIKGNDDLILDRFTIQSGKANGLESASSGGGIFNYCIYAITVTDCILKENDANSSGGGMYNSYTVGETIVNNCKFIENTSKGNGSGVQFADCAYNLSNCTFNENATDAFGGAIGTFSCTATIDNCTFTGNSAFLGGAIFNDSHLPTIIRNCTFSNNSSFGSGGAVTNAIKSSPTIINCVFHNNKTEIGNGGGLYNAIECSPVLSNCTFIGNLADANGGGMYSTYDSLPALKNCIFWGNYADKGNQVYNTTNANPTFSFCDIQDCYDSNNVWDANLGTDGGGNIDSDPCFMNFYDFSDLTDANGTTTTILVADASPYEVNDVIEYDNDGVVRTVTDVNTTTDIVTFANDPLDSNSVSDVRIYNWGIGATDLDEDYHITVNSPCVDTGDPNGDYSGQTDIDGEPRVWINEVDIGADEYHDISNHWKFDEKSGTTAYDSAGDDDGTLTNMDPNTDWVDGKVDGALDFDGTNDYVTMSSVDALAGSSVTITAWIKADALGAGQRTIVYQGTTISDGFYLYIFGGKPCFATEVWLPAQSPTSISTGTWYHIAGTYDGTDFKIYVDGDLKDTTTNAGESGDENNCYIGIRVAGFYFDGIIDDVRVYDEALSGDEIEALYDLTK